MLSRIQNGRHSRTPDFGAILLVDVNRLDFRSVLVIEKETSIWRTKERL